MPSLSVLRRSQQGISQKAGRESPLRGEEGQISRVWEAQRLRGRQKLLRDRVARQSPSPREPQGQRAGLSLGGIQKPCKALGEPHTPR